MDRLVPGAQGDVAGATSAMIIDAAGASASSRCVNQAADRVWPKGGPGSSESKGVGGPVIEWRCVSTDISESREQVVGCPRGGTTATDRNLVRYGLNAGEEN